MPVHVRCPHCRTPCLVAEQHRGVPVKCGRCGRMFTTRAETAASVRLDLGAASSSAGTNSKNCFLVQHHVSYNCDKRQEQAGIIVATDSLVREMGAVLIPLLDRLRSGTNTDAIPVEESLAAVLRDVESKAPSAWVAVLAIHDGEAYLGQVGARRIFLSSAGQVVQLVFQPPVLRTKLAAGDWFLVTDIGHSSLEVMRGEIAGTASALELTQRLIERAGCDNGTVVAVRGY